MTELKKLRNGAKQQFHSVYVNDDPIKYPERFLLEIQLDSITKYLKQNHPTKLLVKITQSMTNHDGGLSSSLIKSFK